MVHSSFYAEQLKTDQISLSDQNSLSVYRKHLHRGRDFAKYCVW